MRPAENGNIVLETKQDYDFAGTAVKRAGWFVVNFAEHGVQATPLEGHFIYSAESPEAELSPELTAAVIEGLKLMADERNYAYIQVPAQSMLESILEPQIPGINN